MESKANFRQPGYPVAGNVSKKHSTGIRLRMLCFFLVDAKGLEPSTSTMSR